MSPDADASPPARERSRAAATLYQAVRHTAMALFAVTGGLRSTGQEHVPGRGAALLVSNHLSFWDVFVLGVAIRRPLNFVARSSLFKPGLGAFIRAIGAFPIQREGIGVQGFKETLRRLKRGGIVALFPEGTRSPDGALQPLKPGIAPLATRARVPILPVGLAGTFEAWPRHRKFPRPHPLRLHVGPPILPEELDPLSPQDAALLIRDRIQQAIEVARLGLDADLGRR